MNEPAVDLLSWRPPASPQQDGDLDIWTDGPRLNSLMRRVFDLMKPAGNQREGRWFSNVELMRELENNNWASVGARIRDMRKPKFKCPCDYEHKDMGGGIFFYRLVRR